MLKKYFDFINESLILESDVVYSDKFRNILSNIDTEISKKLIEIENKDLPVSSNYFDISSKNNMISFIPDKKVQQITKDMKEYWVFIGPYGWLKHSKSNDGIFSKLGYVPEGDTYSPNSEDIGEMVAETVTKSNKTYCWIKFMNSNGDYIGQGVYNKEKIRKSYFYIKSDEGVEEIIRAEDKEKEFWTKNRQEIGVGRGIRALLSKNNDNFLDKDIEQFVNIYKSKIDKLNNLFNLFEVVKGDKIAHWYHSSNYYKIEGTLGKSCMRNAYPSWLEIYTENPEQCSMVILKSNENNNKIVGRALLWTLVDGKKFMDRIYTINDSDVEFFRDYAKENGWYSKYNNNSGTNSESYAPDGTEVDLDLKVILSFKEFDNYPYLDTIKFYTPWTGELNNYDGDLQLNDTDGGPYDTCEYCGGSGQSECGECEGSGNVGCYRCESSGNIECSTCVGVGREHCTTCDGSGEVDDVTCGDCDGDGDIICEDCDGDGKNDCSLCDGDGENSCSYCDGNGTVNCSECN
jgi:hypothetical protein